MADIDSAIQMLRDAFPGFHIHMELYPSGGRFSLEGCEECGTDGRFYDLSWKPGHEHITGRASTASEAIAQLKEESDALRPDAQDGNPSHNPASEA